jgi:hypothetical protein
MTHSELIERIDTVRAYYSGPRIVAEVDIVIDRNERLEVAHDIAEDLQIKLEKLPSIERAFVHIDYETSHKPVSGATVLLLCVISPATMVFALPVLSVGTPSQEAALRSFARLLQAHTRCVYAKMKTITVCRGLMLC